jgi:hypothetical protein
MVALLELFCHCHPPSVAFTLHLCFSDFKVVAISFFEYESSQKGTISTVDTLSSTYCYYSHVVLLFSPLNLTNSGSLNPGGYRPSIINLRIWLLIQVSLASYLTLYHNDHVTSWSFDHEYIQENNILVGFELQSNWLCTWNLISIGTSYW